MHEANRVFWRRLKRDYPQYCDDPAKRVIEFGSYNINGTIRDYFAARDYTGVDKNAGPLVDLVSLAHEVTFPGETFDVVASASMLEHDPHWELSILRMVDLLKPDGLLALTWGGALNGPHCSPDEFFPLRAGVVLAALDALGIYVHLFQYERPAGHEDKPLGPNNPYWFPGEVVLIGFKNRALAVGPQRIDPLNPEDRYDPCRDTGN